MFFLLQCLDWSINSYRQILEWWLTDSKILAELKVRFSSVQLLSHVQLLVTPWTTAHQVSLSITNSWSLLELMSIESVMSSNHLILCSPLLLQPSILSIIQVFSSESVLCIRWPKHWSFSFNISPSKEYSGLISSEMDWLDLLESLLQHHSSKASILWCSAFFMVQLSHPYMTNGKTIALTRWTFIGKEMSLLFNTLSQLVITFSSKEQVSFNLMAKITICSDFGAQKNKVSHCFHCFPIYFSWSDGTRCHDLSTVC